MNDANRIAEQLTHFVAEITEVFEALDADFRPRGRKRRITANDAHERAYEIDQAFAVGGRLSVQLRFAGTFEVKVDFSAGSTMRNIQQQLAQNNVMTELLNFGTRAKAELEEALPSEKRYSQEFNAMVFRVLIGSLTAEEAAERLAKENA